jgi:iron complex transport system substrate-binding protein
MKKIFVLLLVLMMLLSFSACDSQSSDGDDEIAKTRIITDMVGRQVEIPAKVESIVTLASYAPRIAAYLDVMDMVVGTEKFVQDGINMRLDYLPVYYDKLSKLPIVGEGGGTINNGFPEEIIKAAPDVILAGFDAKSADELQRQTGIPVVSVLHQTGLANESFYKAMRIFADVVGAEERCEELLKYTDTLLADLKQRTIDILDSDKLKAYAGAVTFSGRRGMAGTYSEFDIFKAINAINVANKKEISGFYETDLEAIAKWDPDIIFLDPGNMDLVNEEYRTKSSFFDALSAVKNNKVYAMPAFNFMGTNISYAFIDAYYAGIILYPEQFADVSIANKAAEILTTFLGVNTFEDMVAAGLKYGEIKIGE